MVYYNRCTAVSFVKYRGTTTDCCISTRGGGALPRTGKSISIDSEHRETATCVKQCCQNTSQCYNQCKRLAPECYTVLSPPFKIH